MKRIQNVMVYSLVFGCIGCVLSIILSTSYELYNYRSVRLLYDELKGGKKYCVYNPFHFDDGFVFPLDRIGNAEHYKMYYQLQEKQQNPDFTVNQNVFFALKGVYAKHELEDSDLVTIYTIDTICWTVDKKIVYANLVLDSLPKSDSLKQIIFDVESTFGYKCGKSEVLNVLKGYVY
ncbi:MAG: hypothetical protein JNL95_11815 [Chitinophagales bacterium]|nr:hypothetical protein [Chitinophagales bacterium]